MRDLVQALVAAPLDGPSADLAAFFGRADAAAWPGASSVARAALGGLLADRLAYAFAVGYRAALGRLVPSLAGATAALCATERGGAHPRAIGTTLTPEGDGFVLAGHKRWATLAEHVDALLVVASIGHEGDRNRLRVVRVAAKAPGVTLRPMPPPPFCPEIGHAEVDLVAVRVAAHDVLPGDGYDVYLKPFRTIEDEHVVAAALGHAAGCVRRFALDRALLDRAAALLVALEAVLRADPLDPAAHVVLAGVLANASPLFDAVLAALDAAAGDAAATAARLRRDLPLLTVAGSARGKRTARAWELLGEGRAPGLS